MNPNYTARTGFQFSDGRPISPPPKLYRRIPINDHLFVTRRDTGVRLASSVAWDDKVDIPFDRISESGGVFHDFVHITEDVWQLGNNRLTKTEALQVSFWFGFFYREFHEGE